MVQIQVSVFFLGLAMNKSHSCVSSNFHLKISKEPAIYSLIIITHSEVK